VSEPELTPEQLIEQIKQLKVADLVLSTVTTLAQLGYAKLEDQSRDLDQARLAIDTIGVLLPKLEGQIPPEILRDLGSMHTNLQLAYANAASANTVE
jgi:Domain of unknown function (DUF1844)